MKKDWHPFKGIELEILFRGQPTKWRRGNVVEWSKYTFRFHRRDRVRPMSYLQEEIVAIKIVWRPNQT
jgi:hypothetical protein